MDIEWSAGSNGVRQTVYSDDNRSLSITLTNEGMIIDLIVDGEVVGTEAATYEEIMEGLS